MSDQHQVEEPIVSELLRDDSSFADLVCQFVDGLSERLETMLQAIHTQDFEQLLTAAHQLKGSGGGYGYPVLTQLAAELEQKARANSLEGCQAALAEIERTCARVVVGSEA